MKAIPPLYLSYFYSEISMLNWQLLKDKSFVATIFGKKGALHAYNYTFELQNIKDTLLFINIFDMFIFSLLFWGLKMLAKVMEQHF